jgi:hypothetical protein
MADDVVGDTVEIGAAGGDRPDGLYRRLLGAAWEALDPAVQRVHVGQTSLRAEGVFQVRRAPGWLAGLLLDVAGVPPAAEAIPVRLAVQRRGPVERWHRVFGSRPLVTLQRAAPDGRLIERIGSLELRFRLLVEDGALLFRQERLAVCLGSWRLRVPGWLALRVDGREGPADANDRTSVVVEVRGPTGGLLFGYRGTVRWAEPGREASG